jgi:hypothetical protein
MADVSGLAVPRAEGQLTRLVAGDAGERIFATAARYECA